MHVFITGDRSFSPIYFGLVAVEMLKAVSVGAKIVTGVNAGGVEQMTRELGKLSGIEITTVENFMTAEGHVDWDERHAQIDDGETQVVLIHTDPMGSRVVKSALAQFSDDGVRVVTPADLIVS